MQAYQTLKKYAVPVAFVAGGIAFAALNLYYGNTERPARDYGYILSGVLASVGFTLGLTEYLDTKPQSKAKNESLETKVSKQ